MERIVALLWSGWKARNNNVFRHEFPNPGLTLIRAKWASAEWRSRHGLTNNLHPTYLKLPVSNRKQPQWIRWSKPQGGFIKIDFDGSKLSRGAARGFIIRNWDDQFLQASDFNLGAGSVLIAEATTMRNGLQEAIQARYTDIHIEGDNQILIFLVQGRIQPPWEIHTLVQDILTYVKKCNKILISHIFREGNRGAAWVAKSGHAVQFKIVWYGVPHQDRKKGVVKIPIKVEA